MHICFLCNEYPSVSCTYGGVGTFTQTLGRALVARGHRVTVIGAYPTQGVSDDHGVLIHQFAYMKTRGVSVLQTAWCLRRTIQRIHAIEPIQIIDTPELGLPALTLARSAVRVIRMNGGHHFFAHTLKRRPRLLRSLLERLSFANADALCAVSSYVAETTRVLLQLGSRPITILPNPVDTSHFRPSPDLTPVSGRIVFVGTLTEKKGVRQLVQAMPEIVRRVPHASLLVIGRDSRDPNTGSSYRERLVQEIDPVLRKRIIFQGPVANWYLPELLASAQVCVYPSHMEAQGIVVCEAMSMGKPVVASLTGPGPEIVEYGLSGLLCDPYNSADIAEKIIVVLSDPRLANQLGVAARVRALEHFSVDVLVQRNESFYTDCLSRQFLVSS